MHSQHITKSATAILVSSTEESCIYLLNIHMLAIRIYQYLFVPLIIGSDRWPESKQGKIVRSRSCLRHFWFIISCAVVKATILSIWR